MIFTLFPEYKLRFFSDNNRKIYFILLSFKSKAEKEKEFKGYKTKLKNAYRNLLKIKQEYRKNVIIYETTIYLIDNLKKQWQILKNAEQINTKYYANIVIKEEYKVKDYQFIALKNIQEYYRLKDQFELLYMVDDYSATKAYAKTYKGEEYE